MLSKNSDGLAPHRVLERLVELRVLVELGLQLVEILQPQPLAGKARRERLGSPIGEHPPHLLLEAGRRPQQAGAGRLDQLRVRTGAPQEEGQPRRQIVVGDAVGARRRRRGCRRPFEPEDELRADEDRLQRHADAVLEVAALAAPS